MRKRYPNPNVKPVVLQALVIHPGNAIYLSNRAAAYTHLNSFEMACQDCEEAILQDKGYAKAYSRLGFSHYQLGNYQQSIEGLTPPEVVMMKSYCLAFRVSWPLNSLQSNQ